MSEQQDEAATGGVAGGDQDETRPWDLDPADWYLALLVQIVNGTDAEFGITLTVGGVLVTGKLAGGHRFFRDFADTFTESFTNQGSAADKIRESLAKPAEMYDDPEALGRPGYIHVRDARIFMERDRPLPDGTVAPWWRGRLDRVDGWTLGEMKVS